MSEENETEEDNESGTEVVLTAEASTEVMPSGPVTPMVLLQMAVSQGADLEKIEKFMDMQDRFEANEARKAFNNAMAGFKSEAPEIVKDASVSYETDKGVTSYDHATLANIVSAVSPILSKYDLSHKWQTKQGDGGVHVTCIIAHKMGHSEETPLHAAPDTSGGKNAIQSLGSTVSYLERYTLLAALGLAVKGQDNDAIPTGCITDDEIKELNEMLDDKGIDKQSFCKRFDINSIPELPATKFRTARNSIKSAKSRKKDPS